MVDRCREGAVFTTFETTCAPRLKVDVPSPKYRLVPTTIFPPPRVLPIFLKNSNDYLWHCKQYQVIALQKYHVDSCELPAPRPFLYPDRGDSLGDGQPTPGRETMGFERPPNVSLGLLVYNWGISLGKKWKIFLEIYWFMGIERDFWKGFHWGKGKLSMFVGSVGL